MSFKSSRQKTGARERRFASGEPAPARLRPRRTRYGVKGFAAASTALLVALGTTAVGASASENGHHKKAKGALSQLKNLHPTLKGQSVTFVTQGSPTPGRWAQFNVGALLRKWGAKVTFHYEPTTNVALAEEASGAAQVFIGSITNILPVVKSGGISMEVFGVDIPSVTYALVAVDHITKLSQLKGKSIAISTGGKITESYIFPQDALETVGLKMTKDINVVPTGGQSVRVAALISGRVQASALHHPNAKKVVDTAGGHILYTFTRKLHIYTDLLWAPPTWLKKHQELAAAIDLAYLESYHFINNPKNKTAVLVRMLKTSLTGTFKSATTTYANDVKYDVFKTRSIVTPKAIDPQMTFLVKMGSFTTKYKFTTWATTRYDKAALKVFNKFVKTHKKK